MSKLFLSALVVINIALVLSNLPAQAASRSPSGSCSAEVYRQFDFWIGDWDTFDSDAPNKPSIARNHVDAILDGCVLREDYDQFDGLHGQSFTTYDASRKVWHQSWVTNRGGLLVMEGTQQGRRIVLSGIDTRKHVLMRVSWEAQGHGVREIARQSSDNSAQWQPVFDIVFRPHRS
ncbi:hypothetical protein [Rhodanobacter sp. L36]|uniref:hypothetical protein n=1 Tax=Rhodanobacter sp. L36 TaxID=1747221 RepID=UPI00131E2EFA|nr:hypothetical protein [Rhodanobacter sp. L36]